MNPNATFTRPPLPDAIDTWKKTFAGHGFSTDLLWVFEENLCFEKEPGSQGEFKLGFQTKFTSPPEDALDIAYDHFCESDSRLVFYRLGECRGRSICILLGDPWFEPKGEGDGYVRRDEWRMSFYPGRNNEIEEVTDMRRWVRRTKRERPLHDLDFCMTLTSIEEIRDHGRVLTPYERFTEHIVGKLRRLFAHAQ